MNDIIFHIDSNVRINEIRMQMAYQKLKKQFKSFLIVEGESDLSFFKKFISEEKCDIIFANGKENVIEIISELEKETIIIGIVDADFWHINGINPESQNIIVTDFHDIEIMMLNTRALESILDEFGITEKIKKVELKRNQKFSEILFQEGLKIGYFRLLKNRALEFGDLNFKNLQFELFLNVKELIIDLTLLIQAVKKNSENWILIEENLKNLYNQTVPIKHIIINEIDKLKNEIDDCLQICRGHDLTKMLFIMLIKEIGNKDNPNFPKDRNSLESNLRIAYTSNDFLQTDLFKSIKKWCSNNKIEFLEENRLSFS